MGSRGAFAECGDLSDLRAPETPVVLVLHAEEPIRGLIRRMIEPERCEVVEAADVAEALSALPSFPKPVDLVVASMIEPRLLGAAGLAKRLRARTRLLLLSLFATSSVVPAEYCERIVVLRNPFRADALKEKVRELLARPKNEEIPSLPWRRPESIVVFVTRKELRTN